MSRSRPSFEEILEFVRALPREKQVRLFQAVGLDAGRVVAGERPAPEAGAEYHCGRCGAMLPLDELPPKCPECGAPRSEFVLEAED